MKNYILFFFILFSNLSWGQILNKDTCKTNYNFDSGIITEYSLDSGTYVYAISSHFSYIEFSLPYFGKSNAKYRVEKLLNLEIFIVTKTYLTNNKLASTCFLAIDSTIADKIKMNKKVLKDLKKNRIYENVRPDESVIFYYISRFIIKHNLQSSFSNFNPKLFVAWLKVKNTD